MAQYGTEHLTNEQISAYLDQALAPEELALFEAHLQTCQSCQDALADLRLTSSLLKRMPEVEVPRSFVLPLNLAALPERPSNLVHRKTRDQPEKRRNTLRNTLRVLSTLAAVIGLIFVCAGLIPLNKASMNFSATSASAPQKHSSDTDGQATSGGIEQPSVVGQATVVPTTPTVTDQSIQETAQPLAWMDLNQPGTRLTLGLLIALAGLLGFVLSSRRWRTNVSEKKKL